MVLGAAVWASADLDAAWRECLELAWQAYAADTIPVGAVVVDPAGEVIARGRNRVYDRDAPPGELRYSLLAHAEVNALAQLRPDGRYEDHVLLTTLEPCLLCMGAARLATVGEVRFAGSDPYGGTGQLDVAGVNSMLARVAVRVAGPDLGRLGRLMTALHAEFFLRRAVGGHVVAAYRASEPALLAAAEALLARDVYGAARKGRPLAVVAAEVWDLLDGS
ncbi:MAG: nucleoside deaminase [Thermoleophilia bacterium]|nr:nucleoside deaminase [Thermoleophilia bacterium]